MAESITSGILMPTGPRNPIGAPAAFSIVAASAATSTDAPTTRRSLASFSSWSPRNSAATGLPSAEVDQKLGRGRFFGLRETRKRL